MVFTLSETREIVLPVVRTVRLRLQDPRPYGSGNHSSRGPDQPDPHFPVTSRLKTRVRFWAPLQIGRSGKTWWAHVLLSQSQETDPGLQETEKPESDALAC